MSRSAHVVTGRVRRSDTHQGVHGLRVEAWDPDLSPDAPLGAGYTNSDGSYRIRFCVPEPADSCCADGPRVFIKVRDRDCRPIYDGCGDRRCATSADTSRFDADLAPATLHWHLSRPVSWDLSGGWLVPPVVFDQIDEAARLIDAPSIAECITPAIEGFDRVLDDAAAALRGDVEAATRFRDVLHALCGDKQGCGSRLPYGAEIEALFKDACEKAERRRETCTPCDAPPPCEEKACTCGCDDDKGCSCGCGCDVPLVPTDKTLVLIMAALHVACGDRATAQRYVRIVLDQICRFEMLGALHRTAVKALLGDPRARIHLRDLLQHYCDACGPDRRDGCRPHRAPGCCDTCLADRLIECAREAIEAWCCIDCYCVRRVDPPRACPGETIVIHGCGFGDVPGRVVFRAQGSTNTPIAVEPREWCDDRISVVVPRGAGCGMWLELPPNTIEVCGRFLEYGRIGCIEQGFEGTSPEILRFGVKAHTEGECLQPGEPVEIRWMTCAADRVRVEIVNRDTGATIAVRDPADPSGFWNFEGTNFTTTTRIRVQVTAFGKCSPTQVSRHADFVIQRRPNLSAHGIEITQAIQYYRASEHLTDAADRGPDNSLRLVVNKTAWVRTYLRSGQDPSFDNGQLAGITGTLRIERRTNGVWSTVATLPPQNGPVTAEDAFVSYDAERGNINTTLNFVVPASIMTGLLRFRVDVRSPFSCPGNSASASRMVNVNLQQTLNAAFITIGYDGPDNAGTGTLTLPAPTVAECQAETSWAMTTYPVSGAPNVRVAGTFVTNTPLNDPRSCAGCCSPNWQPLLQSVAALVALDQASNPGDWVYYGIITGGIPVNVPGCNGWGATGGLAGRPETYAHEIGHQFGLPHARCGNAGSGNASYPVYEPYDLPVDPPGTTNWTMASIGEYGLDINSGAIANPNSAEDFMSYCGPRWMSLYTHNHLTNITELSPVVIPTGEGALREIENSGSFFSTSEKVVRPLVHMLGTIGVDGRVEMASVARIETRYLRGRGRDTGYVAELVDAKGRVIAADTVYGYPPEGCGSAATEAGCGCGCKGKKQPILFKAMLDDVAPGASLRIVKRGEVVWERRARKAPAVRSARAVLSDNRSVEIAWKIDPSSDEKGQSRTSKRDADHVEPEVWVRWSNDEGRTWHALTVGQRGSSVAIDAEQLPAGEVTFQVLVNDGFSTVAATTNAVTVPKRPPVVTILYPRAGAPRYGERQIHLFGTATEAGGALVDDKAASWYVDGKPVATGFDAWVDDPGEGLHEVRLEVETDGLVGSAAVWLGDRPEAS